MRKKGQMRKTIATMVESMARYVAIHAHTCILFVWCKLIVSHLSIFYYCVLDRILGEVWNMR